jgi:hypothetical protein
VAISLWGINREIEATETILATFKNIKNCPIFTINDLTRTNKSFINHNIWWGT